MYQLRINFDKVLVRRDSYWATFLQTGLVTLQTRTVHRRHSFEAKDTFTYGYKLTSTDTSVHRLFEMLNLCCFYQVFEQHCILRSSIL
jgi:hypothetical protein